MDSEFSLLRQVARHDLVHLLEAATGVKDLVIEQSLMKSLDKVSGGMTLLKEHGVSKLFQLAGGALLPWGDTSERRMYMVRPTLTNSKFICDHVLAERNAPSAGAPKQFTVVFVPRRLRMCERIFEEQGVYGQVDLQEFNPSFLILESDLLSLELPEFFSSFFLDCTNMWTLSVARSLWHLQSLYGPIPRVYGLGNAAREVTDLMDTLFWEYGEPKVTAEQPFSHLVLLDRSLDYVTVFLSCLTYESLLHEAFGINCAQIEFDDAVMSKIKAQGQSKRVMLNNSDEVFASVRDKHITAVFPFLSAKARNLQEGFNKSQALDKVSELKTFVSQELRGLKSQHKSLELHISASEVVMERSKGISRRIEMESFLLSGINQKEVLTYLEDNMCQQQYELQTLAAICLFSLTQNGLSNKDFSFLRTQYLQAHGHKHLSTFYNLKKLGIVYEKTNPITSAIASPVLGGSRLPQFQSICRKLGLIPKPEVAERINLRDPSELSYVFNGAYTPALCQVLLQILQYGFNQEDLSKIFLCPVVNKENTLQPGQSKPAEPREHKAILAYFLGGVTYAEIAALRLLARLKGYRIVIAATHVISRQEVLKGIMP